jgi:hypothetical protein
MRMFLERHGVACGTLLLLLVSATAALLARKAARGVDHFRDEHHERFTSNQIR